MSELYARPKLTYSVIAICIGVFIFELAYGFAGEDFSASLSYIFANFGFSLQALLGQKVWTFLTATFLHADFEHLFLNMLALFFFGRVVEMNMGRKKFILIFLSSAAVGDMAYLASSIFFGTVDVPLIGASAGIFGLMGAAMLVNPLEFVFYPYLIPVPLILVAIMYTFYNIVSFVLVAASLEESNIAYVSHIGGLATGMLFGFREEKSKKGFVILIFLLGLLLLTPFLWTLYAYLENFNYISVFSWLFR
jgi:uncharacterized protein